MLETGYHCRYYCQYNDLIQSRATSNAAATPSLFFWQRSLIFATNPQSADPRDPTNRKPLTANDIVEQPDFKARVHAWIAEHRAKAAGQAAGVGTAAAPAAGQGMDWQA